MLAIGGAVKNKLKFLADMSAKNPLATLKSKISKKVVYKLQFNFLCYSSNIPVASSVTALEIWFLACIILGNGSFIIVGNGSCIILDN